MNILTPHLIRLTEDCRRNDYYYANGPKIKIAVSPNDMPLSLQRMDIIGAYFLFLGHVAYAAIFKRLMEIHSNPPLLYYGF